MDTDKVAWIALLLIIAHALWPGLHNKPTWP